jgi:methyl-accepting chemotaxis protein
MGQLSKATQQNASASEELAATSEELSGQAEQLQQSVAFFTWADRWPRRARHEPAPARGRHGSRAGPLADAAPAPRAGTQGNFRPY